MGISWWLLLIILRVLVSIYIVTPPCTSSSGAAAEMSLVKKAVEHVCEFPSLCRDGGEFDLLGFD